MKNVKLIALLLGVIALLAVGCTREITGDVQLADNSSSDCFECHDGADDLGSEVVLATRQWENSMHASGATINRNSGSCAPCHTNEGFVEAVSGEDINSEAFNALGCFTCHDPHTTGDFQLRTVTAVELGNGAMYDRNESNLCVNCHKGRRDVATYVVDSTTLSSHFGPHHSNQSDMLLGENAYEYAGYDYDEDSWHTVGVVDGCLKCHYDVSVAYELGGHTFWMESEEEENTDACNVDGCHVNDLEIDEFDRLAAADFDGDGDIEGVNDEIAGLLTELETLLLSAGLISGDPGDTHPNSVLVPDADTVGAVFNFGFVMEDQSNGIHNTRYAVALLQSSINYMTTGDPEGIPARKSELLTAH